MTPISVLLVDDQELFREGLGTLLTTLARGVAPLGREDERRRLKVRANSGATQLSQAIITDGVGTDGLSIEYGREAPLPATRSSASRVPDG